MQEFIQAIMQRLQQEYPSAIAILLKGSHARGEASTWSDIDFDVLVSEPDFEEYRAWIEPWQNRLVHISTALETADAWERDSSEPSPWSLGLPTIETTKLMWAVDEPTRLRFDHPHKSHPPAEPEIEDTMEALGKIRNAIAKGDTIGVYRNANKMATLLPTMLVPINPTVAVSNSRQAIDAVLAFPNVPTGFAADWCYCMGYVDQRTPAETLVVAARLFAGVLELVSAHPDVLDQDFSRMIQDGTLRAYLAQTESRR